VPPAQELLREMRQQTVRLGGDTLLLAADAAGSAAALPATVQAGVAYRCARR
jgi:hypothetical protein